MTTTLRYEQNLDAFDVFEGDAYCGELHRGWQGRWEFVSSDSSVTWQFGRSFDQAWAELCRRYHAR